jgi:hypothetical protein
MNLWPGEHETRNEKFSKTCARQHKARSFKHSHIRGHFASVKCEKSVYYASSYELRCMFVLESDPLVTGFQRCDAFKGEDGWRNPDLLVDFADGRREVWEIKPENMLVHEHVKTQIGESEAFAESNGFGFRVWTEKDSGLGSDHEIIKWARDYLLSLGDGHRSEAHKESRKKIRERYYAKKSADKIDVWCDFCNTTHLQLRMTYERNVKRNGGAGSCGLFYPGRPNDDQRQRGGVRYGCVGGRVYRGHGWGSRAGRCTRIGRARLRFGRAHCRE